ncbi:MAG TPA: tetratricopeptide repeat protein [Nocardioides sp.]|uniref:tetratricopeptide repeat protein n=1 Tax=Nocardioides sp. TaxID=35761 RepID=UPI002E342928|nr:tetratricopeptide repeat protein [Nocardioides sp.]HEX5086685.1 tetratricopeptide repeat protein [Nocardioides sp.]
MDGDLDRVHALVLDPRRFGSVAEREAYFRALESRYLDVETAMNRMMALPTWDDRSSGWVDDQLALTTAVVHQVGTLRGEYDDARSWGDDALARGRHGSPLRRADLMLHLSELHRVTGRFDRAKELVSEAVELLHLDELSAEDVDALAPVTCHAFFCLGALAYWEGRPDEARPLLQHAMTHGGDSVPHLWSLVNHALMVTDAGDHESALAFEEAAVAMAERMGDALAITAVRNNRAGTLRHLGRLQEAHDEFAAILPGILADDIPDAVLTSCEDFACVLFDMGHDRDAALLVGAAGAEREDTGVPRMPLQEAAVATSIAAGRERLGADWEPLLARGAELGVLAAVASALRSPRD